MIKRNAFIKSLLLVLCISFSAITCVYAAGEGVVAEPISFCKQEGIIRIVRIAGTVKNIMKILVPVLLIVMASIDIGKALLSGDEKDMKEATTLMVKRLIAGLIVFFIPTIVDVILNNISNYSTSDYAYSKTKGDYVICTKCFSSPSRANCEDAVANLSSATKSGCVRVNGGWQCTK